MREATFKRVVHPGEVLKDQMDEIGISARELARQLNVPPNRITEILNGRRGITGDTALRLGHWFGTGPEIWQNLQSTYERNRAEKEVGAEIRGLPKYQPERL